MKTLYKVSELKKEFTTEEAEALERAFASKLNLFTIDYGASPIEKLKAQKAQDTAAAVENLFGFPYISNSINDTAAAIWNTNTETAAAITSTRFDFLGLAIAEDGEGVALLQEKTKEGEEVGEVLAVSLSNFIQWANETEEKKHEAKKVAELEEINRRRAAALELLPEAVAVLNKYNKGRSWGEGTEKKINAELFALSRGDCSVNYRIQYNTVFVCFCFSFNYSDPIEIGFDWNKTENHPANILEITPEKVRKLQRINIEKYRKDIKKYQKEIETTAEKLTQLLNNYNNLKNNNSIYNSISPYNVDLSKLTAKDLDR